MTRNQFIQDLFLSIYPCYLDELLQDYDEEAGEKTPKINEHINLAFQRAAETSHAAAVYIESLSPTPESFWDNETSTSKVPSEK